MTFTPASSARPSKEDREVAARYVEEDYKDKCPVWLANNRDELVRLAAQGVMQSREYAEWRARFAAVDELKMGEAA